MKVGDLVTIAGQWERLAPGESPRCTGIITCLDPEELGCDAGVIVDEVEVAWLTGFTDVSNHSTWNLEVISENR